MILLLTALAGGLGGVARFTVDSWVAGRNRTSIPMGTIVVNVTACLLLGTVTGWAAGMSGSAGVKEVLGIGLLGGYSTFSTASVEGMRLVAGGRPSAAAVHAGGMLGLSLAASTLGLIVGRGLT